MLCGLRLRLGIELRLVGAMLMIVSTMVLSSCAFLSDCTDTVISESPSPSGDLQAVVYERDCGATTDKNTQMCFRRKTEPFDSEKQSSFLVFEGDGRVVLSWKTQNNLVIRLPQGAKVFRKEAENSGVKLEYEIIRSLTDGLEQTILAPSSPTIKPAAQIIPTKRTP